MTPQIFISKLEFNDNTVMDLSSSDIVIFTGANNAGKSQVLRDIDNKLYRDNHKLVKEFGEGVDRMFREMAEAGLPAPEYRQNEFMVYATIRQHGDVVGQLNGELNGELNASQKATLQFIIEHEGCTASGISEMTKIPFSTIDKHVRVLLKVGMIERRGSKKTGGYYPVTKK